MDILFLSLSLITIVLNILPFVRNQHWVFRVPEFIKIQILILQIFTNLYILVFIYKTIWVSLILIIQGILIIYNTYLLTRFISFKKSKPTIKTNIESFKIISANIYQFNTQFKKFKDLIKTEKPNFFITIESNKNWEYEMRSLENEYPYTKR